MPSMCEALSSVSSTVKKERKKSKLKIYKEGRGRKTDKKNPSGQRDKSRETVVQPERKN